MECAEGGGGYRGRRLKAAQYGEGTRPAAKFMCIEGGQGQKRAGDGMWQCGERGEAWRCCCMCTEANKETRGQGRAGGCRPGGARTTSVARPPCGAAAVRAKGAGQGGTVRGWSGLPSLKAKAERGTLLGCWLLAAHGGCRTELQTSLSSRGSRVITLSTTCSSPAPALTLLMPAAFRIKPSRPVPCASYVWVASVYRHCGEDRKAWGGGERGAGWGRGGRAGGTRQAGHSPG